MQKKLIDNKEVQKAIATLMKLLIQNDTNEATFDLVRMDKTIQVEFKIIGVNKMENNNSNYIH